MTMHVSKLLSIIAAQNVRHGKRLGGPDYAEEAILDELEQEAAEAGEA